MNRPGVARSEAGFSLIEVLVATVIATIAVLGLAYTFGTGRGYIDRYQTARAALADAEARLEALAVLPSGSADLSMGTHTAPFVLDGQVLGATDWTVTPYDDPTDGLGGSDPQPNDLKRVVVEVSWSGGVFADTVRLERLLPAL